MRNLWTLVLLLPLMAACQDHHFIPIDKADEKEFPKPPALQKQDDGASPGAKEAVPSFHDGGQTPQKEVMTDRFRKGGGYADKNFLDGVLELGGEPAGRDIGGYIVYVLAWDSRKEGPPIAVGRFKNAGFPFRFSLDEGDVMMPGVQSDPDLTMRIEARLDKDGDVLTRDKGDYYGNAAGLARVGDNDIRVVISQAR